MNKTMPVMHQNYTLKQIFENLSRQKPPELMMRVEGRYENLIQHKHVPQKQLLGTPGWAESRWMLVHKTKDNILLFRSVEDVSHLVDAEIDWTTDDPSAYWVTPINFPLSQPL